MCFVDLEKVFDRVLRKVLEWSMRKKRIPEDLVRSVMGLYEGAKTCFRVDSKLSEEFDIIVGIHKGSVLSPFVFALMVDVVTELAKKGALSELLHADDIVLMSETIEGLMGKFLKLKEALEGKGLKVNLGKSKVMVSSGNTKDGLYKSKVDPCGVSSLRAKVNSVLCAQCGKWIHGRCAGVKRVTPKCSSVHAENMKGILERQWSRKMCDDNVMK